MLTASTTAISVLLNHTDTLSIPGLTLLSITDLEKSELPSAHQILCRFLSASTSKLFTLMMRSSGRGGFYVELEQDAMKLKIWNCPPLVKAEILSLLPQWLSCCRLPILSVELDIKYEDKWDITNAELEDLMRGILDARSDVQYFKAQGVKRKVDQVKG